MNKSFFENLRGLELTTGGNPIAREDRVIFKGFLRLLTNVTIVYRYAGNNYLNCIFKSDTSNIEVLSKHIFLFGDKGKLFYDNLNQKTFNIDFTEIEHVNFKFIYCKLHKVFVETERLKSEKTKNAVLSMDNYDSIATFFYNITADEWFSKVMKLSYDDKIILKDYYIAFLHTVGLSGFGKNTYFLSTSSKIDFCESLYQKNLAENHESGIIIVGWTNKQNQINICGKKNSTHIKKMGFPIINNKLFPNQYEITMKCGLLPHFIIGFIYGDRFEINPYILRKFNISTVCNDGVPVDQTDFQKFISETNIKSYYNVCDGYYWMNNN